MRTAATDNTNPETNNEPNAAPNRERSYLNTVLTVIAALLALIAFDLVVGTPAPSAATAAGRMSTASGQINPAVQRQEMIVELRRLSGQMNEINAALGGALEVTVVKMPAGGSGD